MKGLYFVVGVVLALFLFEGSAQAGHRHRHQSVHHFHQSRKQEAAVHPDCNIWFPCEVPSGRAPTLKRPAVAPAPFAWFIWPHEERVVARHEHEYEPRVASVGGRPSDCYGIPWCGCYLRHVFGLRDRSLNLAVKWAGVGHATSPHVGAIVVWRHHVGRIVAQEAGQWIVESGNDGHRVRARPRSLHGAIAVREL